MAVIPARPPVSVHFLPALIPPESLRGCIAVVVDVLRATTAMVQALASGVEAIRPCLEIDEARALAARLDPGQAILGGERKGLPIAGFDLGNSPASYTPGLCSGKTLVMTTTNGTRAILASLEAERVLIGGFVNESATVGVLATAGLPIHVICAGTDGEVSWEDSLLAGCIVDYLSGVGIEPGNDSARLAAAAWADSEVRVEIGYSLADLLSEGRGGRRVREIGLADDLEAAADFDRFDFAAELRRDPLRIVRVS